MFFEHQLKKIQVKINHYQILMQPLNSMQLYARIEFQCEISSYAVQGCVECKQRKPSSFPWLMQRNIIYLYKIQHIPWNMHTVIWRSVLTRFYVTQIQGFSTYMVFSIIARYINPTHSGWLLWLSQDYITVIVTFAAFVNTLQTEAFYKKNNDWIRFGTKGIKSALFWLKILIRPQLNNWMTEWVFALL